MTDRNGQPITVGATAVVLRPGLCNGDIGTVRAVSNRCAALRFKPGVRVSAGDPEGDGPYFSAWCRPSEVAVFSDPSPRPAPSSCVPAPSVPTAGGRGPAGAEGGAA